MDNITIFEYKEAATKTGQNAGAAYLAIETNLGRVSCFDAALFDKLKEAKGKEISVSITTNGDFKNLVAVGEVIGPGKERTYESKGKSKESYGRDPDAIIRTDAYKIAVDMCIGGVITKDQIDEFANGIFTKIKG